MNPKIGPHQVIDLPAARREMPNLLEIFWWKHWIYGLIEVDVTIAKQFIAQHKERTGETLSFTGYLAFCLARAVDEDKSVQACLKGRKKLMLFEDVDISLPVERQIDGTRAPMVHIIRGANHKSYTEIHQEIRAVQASPVPPSKGFSPWLLFFMRMPWPVPRLVTAVVRAYSRYNPALTAALAGTVGLTSVGMFGKGQGGWGVVPMVQSLSLIVGSTAWKPAVVDGRVEPRELLCLTIALDHDVVDGAPAARFGRQLVELIESGYGLVEIEQARSYPVGYLTRLDEGQLSRLKES